MITRWSLSSSNFYAVIGENLAGEFMSKIYAVSSILVTLTAEADKVLRQLVMLLTVFFHWMYKMNFSCCQESWLVCLLRNKEAAFIFGCHREIQSDMNGRT